MFDEFLPTVTTAAGGFAVGGIGAIPGAFVGLFGSMNYGLETINTFNELLQEEIEAAKSEETPAAEEGQEESATDKEEQKK